MTTRCKLQTNLLPKIMTFWFTKSSFVPAFFTLSLLNNSGISLFSTSVTTFTQSSMILHGIEIHFSAVTIFPSSNLNSVLNLKLFMLFFLFTQAVYIAFQPFFTYCICTSTI